MNYITYLTIKGTQTVEFVSGEHERDIARVLLNAAAAPKHVENVESATTADGTRYTIRRAYGFIIATDELRDALAFYNAFERCEHLTAALADGTALLIAEFMEVVQ